MIRNIMAWAMIVIPLYIFISLMAESSKSLMEFWNFLNLFNKIFVVVILIFIGGIGAILLDKKK